METNTNKVILEKFQFKIEEPIDNFNWESLNNKKPIRKQKKESELYQNLYNNLNKLSPKQAFILNIPYENLSEDESIKIRRNLKWHINKAIRKLKAIAINSQYEIEFKCKLVYSEDGKTPVKFVIGRVL